MYHKHKPTAKGIARLALTALVLIAVCAGNALAATDIWVSQATGKNVSTTTGTATDPFKSVTYAMLTMAKKAAATDPWVLHIKAGTYDSDTAKPITERETFPIELRTGMTVQGEDGAAVCILSGKFNTSSLVPLMRGQNLNASITVKNLTFQNMSRTGGTNNGAGIELITTGGTVDGCVFKNNTAGSGGGLWASVPSGITLTISNNTFTSNTYSGFVVSGALTGNVFDNTFSSNSSSFSYGGGFYVSGALTGNVSDNTFTSNSGSSGVGGGFFVSGALTGNVSGNTFTSNSGSGFSTYSLLSGDVSGNTFTSNSGSGFSADKLTGNVSSNTFISNFGSGFSTGKLTGNVSGNTFTSNSGSGFNVSGALTGNVSGNTFASNSYSGVGGGFNVSSALTGNVFGNTFTSNSSCGFYVSGALIGNIFDNTFSSNSSYYYGGGFFLGSSGGQNAIISNNYFLYNTISYTPNKLNGGAIRSNQNVTVINNTFYSGNAGEACVNITNNAPKSMFTNNIFYDTDVAIWEQGELNLPITNNDFYNVTDILNRGNTPMSNDIGYLELMFVEFTGNHDWNPGLAGENLIRGSCGQNPTYDSANNYTVITDSAWSWTADQWKGTMINFSTLPTSKKHFPIVGNTSNQLKVRGNLLAVFPDLAGHTYSIDSYRLGPESECIDTGTPASVTDDFKGTARPTGNGFDIGADEFAGCLASAAFRATVNALTAGFDTTGSVGTLKFDYGDGTSGISPFHTYAAVGTYTVKLTATALSGCTVESLRSITTYLPTVSAPTNVQAVSGPNSISLSWTPGYDVNLSGYNVYRSDAENGTYTRANTDRIKGSTFTDLRLTAQTKYYYYVKAIDTNGKESVQSVAVSAVFGKINLAIPDSRGISGGKIRVPVNISNADGLIICSANISVTYDSNILTATAVEKTPLSADYGWSSNLQSGSVAAVITAGATTPPPLYGSGALFYLLFDVKGMVGQTSQVQFTSSGTAVYACGSGSTPVAAPLDVSSIGTFTVDDRYGLGDINGDKKVDSADVYMGLNIAVGNLTPTDQQRFAADVSGDGRTRANDAALILRLALGLPLAPPTGTRDIIPRSLAANINVPTDLTAAAGGSIWVPIRIDDAAGVMGSDFTLNYDPAICTASEARLTSLTQNFILQSNNFTPGQIIMSLSAKEGTGITSGTGALVEIKFNISSSAANGSVSPMTLTGAYLNDTYGRDFASSALQIALTTTDGKLTISGSGATTTTTTLPPTTTTTTTKATTTTTTLPPTTTSTQLPDTTTTSTTTTLLPTTTTTTKVTTTTTKVTTTTTYTTTSTTTTTIPPAPAIPTNVEAVSSKDSVKVSWDPLTDAYLAGYNVYRSSAPAGPWSKINTQTIKGDFYVDTAPPANQTVYYYVTAVNKAALESSPSVVVSVQTNTVKLFIPDASGKAGTDVVLPVSIANADGLEMCSVDIWVKYDSTKLTAKSVDRTVLTSDFVWTANLSTPGIIRAVIAVSSNLQTLHGEGALFNLKFTVNGNAGDVSNLQFDGGGTFFYDCRDMNTEVPLDLTQAGLFTITGDGKFILGDVDGNGIVNDADVAMLKEMIVGNITYTDQQKKAGDISGDGKLRSNDLSLLLRMVKGELLIPAPKTTKSIRTVSAINVSIPNLAMASDRSAWVPINVDDASSITGAEIIINYDPSIVTPVTARPTTLTGNFDVTFNITNPGQIRLLLASNDTTGLTSGSGALAEVQFTQNSTVAAFQTTPISLSSVHLNDTFGRDFTRSSLQITINTIDGSLSGNLYPRGDIDHSMTVDLKDVIAAIQVCSGLTPTVYIESVNGDSKIGLEEVMYGLQMAAGLRTAQ